MCPSLEQGSLLALACDSDDSARGDGAGGGGDGRRERWIWRTVAAVWSGSWLLVRVQGLTENLYCVCPAGSKSTPMTLWSLTQER